MKTLSPLPHVGGGVAPQRRGGGCYTPPMDLRTLQDGLSPSQRCDERRTRIQAELGIDLTHVRVDPERVGAADDKNCEQMFGHVPLPVGYAGPLNVRFSSDEETLVHLPLATTEGALVASVNRGCKAVSSPPSPAVGGGAGGGGCVRTSSIHHGMSRSLVWKPGTDVRSFAEALKKHAAEWTTAAEGTSGHLHILKYEIDESEGHVFLTINADTDQAMGMNMITIAAQAIADWVSAKIHVPCITIAANVDSDKKPSLRTSENGRGYEVIAEATLSAKMIRDVLKSDPKAMLSVAKAKLELGSDLAAAMGHNLHAANIFAALYLATGQDAAHVVEGSLSDTYVEATDDGLKIVVRCPAILVGVRGGGTDLPAQSACLQMLLKHATQLHPCAQLAETIGAAVLAGELSLLAAQAAGQLAQAHQQLSR